MSAIDQRGHLDVLEAIHSAPASRYLSTKPVPEEVIRAVLDAAIRAPNGGNQQGWGWIVVRDSEMKQQIADRYRPWVLSVMNRGGNYSAEEEDPGRGLSERGVRGTLHLADHLADAPVLLLPVLRGVTRWEATLESGMMLASWIFPAVQNLILAARAFGLGTVLTSNARVASEWGLNELLGVPEDGRIMAVIPMGYPERGRFSEPRRAPVEEVIHWDRWTETTASN